MAFAVRKQHEVEIDPQFLVIVENTTKLPKVVVVVINQYFVSQLRQKLEVMRQVLETQSLCEKIFHPFAQKSINACKTVSKTFHNAVWFFETQHPPAI